MADIEEEEDDFMVVDYEGEELDNIPDNDNQEEEEENGEEVEAKDEEEEEAVELYPLIDSEEDKLKDHELYEEYLALTTEIDGQNAKIAEIKGQVYEIGRRPCKTAKEIKDVQHLRVCIEQELLKLNMLLSHAMKLQNSGAARWYGELTISTTLDDDIRLPQPCFQCPTYATRSQLEMWADDDDDDFDVDDFDGH